MWRQQQLHMSTESSSEFVIMSIVDTLKKYVSNVDRNYTREKYVHI